MNLFDSSALICYLKGEDGASVVRRELQAGGACSAVNWSETAQKIAQLGQNWDTARGLLLSYGIEVAPVTVQDAEAAALRWRRGDGLSLADRLCLATGVRLGATVWTADRAWGETEVIRQVR